MNRPTPAQFYDLWHQEIDPQELAFYAQHAQQAHGPILELGCGTGRLLLPLRSAGYAIEGLDCSPEMLELCAQKAAQQKLAVTLHHQLIQSMQLNKQYALIFSALETFQHITAHDEIIAALRAIYDHLQDGGTFVTYLSLPWLYAPENVNEWRTINRAAADNITYTLHEKSIHDPIAQIYHHLYRIKENDEIIADYQTDIRWYSRYEFEMLLQQVGFTEISMQSGYTGDGPFDCKLFSAQKK